MRLVLIVLLLLLFLGALPTWGYMANYGYFPSGLLGLLLLIVIIMAVVGDRRGSGPL